MCACHEPMTDEDVGLGSTDDDGPDICWRCHLPIIGDEEEPA